MYYLLFNSLLLVVAGKYAVVYSLTNWEVLYPVNIDDNFDVILTVHRR